MKTIIRWRALVLLGAVAALLTTVACSTDSTPVLTASAQSTSAGSPSAANSAARPQAIPAADVTKADLPQQPALPKLLTYRSRDYGVSFSYPRQYAFYNARSISEDTSLQPTSDGRDGQFTLARVEIPKGYFPDSDFESGYFILSLNDKIDQQACESSVGDKPQTASVNGLDLKWTESSTGGKGSSSRVRTYVAFTGGSCYELQLGMTTSNDRGLSREVSSSRVFSRLDAILQTVKIQPTTGKPVEQTASSAPSQPSSTPSSPAPQK